MPSPWSLCRAVIPLEIDLPVLDNVRRSNGRDVGADGNCGRSSCWCAGGVYTLLTEYLVAECFLRMVL